MTKSNKNKPSERVFRKLEDLNLIDNFLFQQMLQQKEEGEEFARILLSTVLGKHIRKVTIVSQKNILGIDTDKHGIRLDAYIEDLSDELDPNLADARLIPDLSTEGLFPSTDADAVAPVPDIYDIEPNNTYEKESLPKRIRYYHGLIDSQLLSSGVNYSRLPNLVIIIILPYDPFDKNRMVYTIQNHCTEDASIPYDDGAKKIFLYTRGTEGNPSQELKDMLKYIEKSTNDNATNQDIASIQELVTKVKHKKEVGVNYMKSWEIEEMMRHQGFREGFNDGFNDGFSDGFNDGFNDGNSKGIEQGKQEMQAKINHLNILLTEAGRMDDLVKAAHDTNYQEELLKEFLI